MKRSRKLFNDRFSKSSIKVIVGSLIIAIYIGYLFVLEKDVNFFGRNMDLEIKFASNSPVFGKYFLISIKHTVLLNVLFEI